MPNTFIRNTYAGKRFISNRIAILLPLLILFYSPAIAEPPVEVTTYEKDGVELNAHCRISEGSYAVVFLPSMFDEIQRQYDSMITLASQGITSCFLDVFADMFLPQSSSTFQKVPVEVLAGLLNTTASNLKKHVYLSAGGRGAQLAARTSYYALQHNLQNPPGLLLFSPNFLDGAPEAGGDYKYIDLILKKNRPFFIFQPKHSPHSWHLKNLLNSFKGSGTTIHHKFLDHVRDGYRLREDQTKKEITLTARTGKLMLDAIKMIERSR